MTIRQTTLPQGLMIITEEISTVASVATGLWVGVGTRFETADQNGLSHLLEHMLFKGTATRDARTIDYQIEQVGGSLNAYTSREQTAFFARVLSEDLPLAIELIADMVQHSKLSEADLVKEKAIISQEIAEAEDTPDDLVFDLLQTAAWPDQPLGLPILGRTEDLMQLTQAQLRTHLATHYTAGRAVLVAAGALSHDAVVAEAARWFTDLPETTAPSPALPARYVGGDRVVAKKEIGQIHLCLGFRGVGFDHPLAYAQAIFCMALGGGASSRLFVKVREEHGLAYTVSASPSAFADDGLVSIYLACDPKDANKAANLAAAEMLEMAAHITEDELATAKALCRAGILMDMESTSSRAERLALSYLTRKKIIPVPDVLAKMEAVSVDDIKAFAAFMLAHPLARAAVGPVGGLEPYATMAGWFAPDKAIA